MNEASAAAARALQLPDDVFYADSDDVFSRLAAAIAPTFDTPEAPSPIFALGMPRVIDHTRGEEIPGVVARRYQGARLWEVDFVQNLRIITVDLRTGAVRTVCPYMVEDRDVDPSRSGPEPSDLNRRATLHGLDRFTIPEEFAGDWPAAEYAVTALDHDWVSNTVVLRRKPAPEIGPEPFAAPSVFVDIAAASTFGEPGLRFTVPPVASPSDPIQIVGSVHAPASSVTLVHSTEEPDSFVMVAQLLLVTLDELYPVTIDFAVPVTLRGDAVAAGFAFDLARRPEAANLEGEYLVYVVSGRTVTGPSSLSVKPVSLK